MSKPLLIKALVTSVLGVVLCIPLGAIRGIVAERVALRNGVITDIHRSSVGPQKVAGPILVIPFRKSYVEAVTSNEGKTTSVVREESGQLRFVPEELTVQASADTEHRYRGIYAALLYTSHLSLSGTFSLPENLGVVEGGAERVAYTWEQAYVSLGLSDTRGIKGKLGVVWDDGATRTRADFKGGTATPMEAGVHAMVGKVPPTAHVYRFTMELDLQGAGTWEVVAAGKETTVHLRSPWPHPSFVGQFLPETRTITAEGFDAVWRTSPERSAKYGFLFVLFTFVLFGLYELLKRLAIHPIQYALVGVALALFFLLLVALSEHLPFAAAYAIAAASCVLLLGFYVSYVLRGLRRGAAFAGTLALLYGALYVLLQSEDLALVLGSVLLFAIVAAIMIVTRRVDWYRLTARETPASTEAARTPVADGGPRRL
jgi:inner membrane protein